MAADLHKWLGRIFWRSWFEDLVERVLDEFMEDTSVAWREYALDHGLPGQLILKGVAIDHLDETLARLEGRAF